MIHRSVSLFLCMDRYRRPTCSSGTHSVGHPWRSRHGRVGGREDGRERGLDRTLAETFPCSDPLSSNPNPQVQGA